MKQKKMILPAQIGMATDNRSELIGNGFKTPSKAQLLRCPAKRDSHLIL
jgi:hypothetical protein